MASLGGKEKAAILILGLDKRAAAQILKELSDDELRELKSACDALDRKALGSIDEVMNEFSVRLSTTRVPLTATPAYVSQLITSAVGEERARRVLPDSKPNRLAMLGQLDPKVAAELISREHPQAIAALLYHLDSAIGGKIMKHLPEDKMPDLVVRIAGLNLVTEDALRELEETLSATLGEEEEVDTKLDGVSKAATLVNFLTPETGRKVVDEMSTLDEALAKRVRDARFTIEDVAKADQRGLQLVLREIESDKLLLALKTASDEVRNKLLSCVSSRVADSLREELAVMGPVRVKDVEDAQKRIIDVALQLQKDGKLMIAGAQGDDFV